jgi:hypothetical protein
LTILWIFLLWIEPINCIEDSIIEEFIRNQNARSNQANEAQKSHINPNIDDEFSLRYDDIINEYSFYRLEHPHSPELLAKVRECHQNYFDCEKTLSQEIFALSAKISNQHTALLITEHAKSLFHDILFYIDKKSSVARKICHILSVLSFSQGETKQVIQLLQIKGISLTIL